jgi:hypothetical protein
MLSAILNIFTIALVVIVVVGFAALVKHRQKEPNVSATDVVQPLITGDRLREVLNVNVLDLMSGSEGNFLPDDSDTTLDMYPWDA